MVFSKAVELINTGKSSIRALRNSDKSEQLFKKCASEGEKLGMDALKAPRKRTVPRRYDEHPETAIELDPRTYFRKMYLELMDYVKEGFEKHFEGENTDLKYCVQVERFILKKFVEDVSMDDENESIDLDLHGTESEVEVSLKELYEYKRDFPDFDRLKLHRDMFLDIIKEEGKTVNNFGDAFKYFKENAPVRTLLPELETLLRIMACLAICTATAERSFSILRRLKSYLRSTMKQVRLNHVAVLHSHKDLLDGLNLEELADEFIGRSQTRKNVFSMTRQL